MGSAVSRKDRDSVLLTNSGFVSQEESMSQLNPSRNDLDKSIAADQSFNILDNEETRKLKELEKRVKKHLNSEYKPIDRDAYEAKMVHANNSVPRDILEGLKRKLKNFDPNFKNGVVLNKRLLNTKKRTSVNSIASEVDSKRAGSVGRLIDIVLNKPEKDISGQCIYKISLAYMHSRKIARMAKKTRRIQT